MMGKDGVAEISKLLSGLIEIDTSIGKNNETEACTYLSEYLHMRGVKTELFEPERGRGSVIACIPGKTKSTIVLCAHIDTAKALDSGWRYSAWSGKETDDFVFGRGALDCKGLVAVFAKIMCDIQNAKTMPKKSLVFVASADEECGGALGVAWLLHNTSYFNDVKLVISEGGGFPLWHGNKLYYTLQTGERSVKKFRTQGIARQTMQDYKDIMHEGIKAGYYNDATRSYFMANDVPQEKRSIPKSAFTDIITEKAKGATTLSILPFMENFTQYEGEVIESIDAGNTVLPSKLVNAVRKSVKTVYPNADILPVVSPGYSDNRYFRTKGIPTMGFFPLHEKNHISGMHGENEYISKKSIAVAYTMLSSLITDLIE